MHVWLSPSGVAIRCRQRGASGAAPLVQGRSARRQAPSPWWRPSGGAGRPDGALVAPCCWRPEWRPDGRRHSQQVFPPLCDPAAVSKRLRLLRARSQPLLYDMMQHAYACAHAFRSRLMGALACFREFPEAFPTLYRTRMTVHRTSSLFRFVLFVRVCERVRASGSGHSPSPSSASCRVPDV